MDLIVKSVFLLAGGLVIWGLWRASRGQHIFVVRLVDGEPRSVTGTVTRAFLAQVREIAAQNDVKRGRISGSVYGMGIRLEFSRDFPEGSRQQLRNWWGIHGWRAGRRPVS